jgi:hypothetical protein
MRTIFPAWSDTACRATIAGAALALLGLFLVPMIYVRSPFHQRTGFPVDQPVQFDHRHHVRDDGIDCLYCHSGARKGAWAGVPSTELCVGCHAQIWLKSVQLEPVRRSYFSGEPLAWNRVNQLPDYVYFNHSIHVNRGIGCYSCHGRVDQMALAWQVAPLSMGWCLDCHRDPEPHLRPATEITSMTWQPPRHGRAALGRALAERYGTRRLEGCTTCHR